jgi:hypothetical protein
MAWYLRLQLCPAGDSLHHAHSTRPGSMTSYDLVNRGSTAGRDRDLFLHHHIQTGSGAPLVSCTVGTSNKATGHELDHSPSYSA